MTVTVGRHDPFIDVTRGPYNARGNGVDDDTEAIQRAIDAAVSGGLAIASVFIPPGTYKITDTLVVPYAPGFELHGAGRFSKIIQYTDNTGILYLTTDPYAHHYAITDLFLGHSAQQTSADTNAACITIGGDANAQPFSLIFERLYFQQGFRGIYADTTSSDSLPWGVTIRDCTFQHFSGAAIMSADIAGKPNWRLEHIYIFNTGGGPTPSEAAIFIGAALELVIQNLDLEGWDHLHMQIGGASTPVLIDGYHMENSTFGDADFFVNYIANSGFIARGIVFSGTIDKTYGYTAIFYADGNAGATAVIDGINGSATFVGAGVVNPLQLGAGSLGYVRGVTGTAWAAADTPINIGIAASVSGLRQYENQFYDHSVAKSADYTALRTDKTILVDASGGARTITLPAAATMTGKTYTIKRTSASNNVVVDGNASETIDGAVNKTITTQWGAITVLSDGVGWQIVHQMGTIT